MRLGFCHSLATGQRIPIAASARKLNSYPQFITNIDGLDIHFIHVRSNNPKALPLIITHGWPCSIIEQLKIIDPLTNPTFEMALSNKRKYPLAEFKAFVQSARRYIEITADDSMITSAY
jgi:hypothetical protein